MNTISSNLQYAGGCMSSTAKYVQDSLTPSQATMDKAYSVAMTALKAIAVLASVAAAGAGCYAISKCDEQTREMAAKAAFSVTVGLIALNAYFFPESAKATPTPKVEESDFQKEARAEREEDAAKARQAAITAAASKAMHAGELHAKVGTRQ